MLKLIRDFFTTNIWLKMSALLLALTLWFYVVNELNKGSEADKQFLNKILPPEGMAARKRITAVLSCRVIGRIRGGMMLTGGRAG